MGLPLTSPGQTTFSQFESSYNQAMNTIDGHNHSPGEGVLVPVSGLHIQAPLPFNGYSATGMGYLGLVDAGAGPSITLTMWNDGIDWWVEDGAGNKIRLTKGGGLNVIVGDGGSYTFSSITANSAVIDGWTIASGCLLGANGASYCFDAAGGLTQTAVDGGEIVAIDSYGDTLLLQGGLAALTANGGGQVVCDLSGCYVNARLGLDSDYFGTISEGVDGGNMLASVADGGAFIVDVGKGAPNVIVGQYDGGSVFQVTKTGQLTAGTGATAEAIGLTPAVTGTGVVSIQAVGGGADPDIAIQIAPKGDGGVILAGHIDTANTSGSTTLSLGLPACFDAGLGFSDPNIAVLTDTAGTICAPTGGATTYDCPSGTTIGTIAFSHAYNVDAGYSIDVYPTTSALGSPTDVIGNCGLTYAVKSANGFTIKTLINNSQPTGGVIYCWDYVTHGLGANAH